MTVEPQPEPTTVPTDEAQETARQALLELRAEIQKVVVGTGESITGLIISLLSGGHVLLEGVPGTGKTLLVRALSRCLGADYARIQFTPDLMPSDITGSSVYNSGSSQFEFRPGPIFTDLLLADEINRTPPKTQAALLEAMAERSVTADGTSYQLSEIFTVIATQNPVEQEGTYQLPEAELDRFLLKLKVDYGTEKDEVQIASAHLQGFNPGNLDAVGLRQRLTPAQLQRARTAVAEVVAAPEVVAYAVQLGRASRQHPAVELGLSPRGQIALIIAARAWAWLQGRNFVTPDDVKARAKATMSHRLILRPEATLDGLAPEAVVESLLSNVAVPN